MELVLRDLAEGNDIQTLMEIYPRLGIEDIEACLEYARAVKNPMPDFRDYVG